MFGRILNSLPLKTLRGYEHPELVEMVFQKTLTYRPTVWPEMVGTKSVLDFGGGCGRHYLDAVESAPNIRWAVVETEPMARRAKELETGKLKFFSDIHAAAAWLGDIETIHSNGALQYADDPIRITRELCSLRPERLLWYRLSLGDGSKQDQISPLGDHGPGKQKIVLKRVAFDRIAIEEAKFVAAHDGYKIEARGEDWFRFVR